MEQKNANQTSLLAENSGYKEIDNELQKTQQRNEEVKIRYNTLQEDVCQSVGREFKEIWNKLQYVILPRFQASPEKNLKNWDLWGPLFFTMLLSILVSIKSTLNLGGTICVIFGVVWLGGLVITLNAKFLGAKISLLQTQCILGYCLFPLIIGSVIIIIIPSILTTLAKVLICLGAFIWSSFSSISFVGDIVKNDKTGLALYPIYLFFFTCCCFLSSI